MPDLMFRVSTRLPVLIWNMVLSYSVLPLILRYISSLSVLSLNRAQLCTFLPLCLRCGLALPVLTLILPLLWTFITEVKCELKMLDFSDCTRTGISILTSASACFVNAPFQKKILLACYCHHLHFLLPFPFF